MEEILWFVVAYLTTISFLLVSFSLFFFSVSNAYTTFIHLHLLSPLSTFLHCRFAHWACALATELRCTLKSFFKREEENLPWKLLQNLCSVVEGVIQEDFHSSIFNSLLLLLCCWVRSLSNLNTSSNRQISSQKERVRCTPEGKNNI